MTGARMRIQWYSHILLLATVAGARSPSPNSGGRAAYGDARSQAKNACYQFALTGRRLSKHIGEEAASPHSLGIAGMQCECRVMEVASKLVWMTITFPRPIP